MTRCPGKAWFRFLPWTILLALALPPAFARCQDAEAEEAAPAKVPPPCFQDGMVYTYKVMDKAWSESPYEMVITVREQDRLGERFFQVEIVSSVEKLESRGTVVLRAADLTLTRYDLERKGKKDKEKIERTHSVTWQGDKYQYQKDGKNFGSARDVVQDFFLPGEGWFFFMTLLTLEDVMPKKASQVDLDDCRARPQTFVIADAVELDAGPFKKVSCGILVKRTAKKEYWSYARDEDGLVVRVWPTEDFDVEIQEVEDRLAKVRPAFEKGLAYLEEGDARKAAKEFKKVLKVKQDFLLVNQARAHLKAIEDQ